MSDLRQPDQTPQPNQNETPVPQARIAAPMVLILCSLAALVLSQVIRAGIARELRLTPLLILPVALILFFIGIRSMDKGRLPRWMDKVLTACSSWLGIRAGTIHQPGIQRGIQYSSLHRSRLSLSNAKPRCSHPLLAPGNSAGALRWLA